MKRPNVIPPTKLHVNLPLDVRVRLDAHLYSTVEGRVPHGEYTRFLTKLITDFFRKEEPTDAANP